jgi:hypothetical protein
MTLSSTPKCTPTDRLKSNLTAIEPITGDIKENVHLRYPNVSGTLATGGSLIFLVRRMERWPHMTTSRLTSFGRPMSARLQRPPMSFEVNGKQYVASRPWSPGG